MAIRLSFVASPTFHRPKNYHLRRTIALFRTGTHWLQVCKGRYLKDDLQKRLCPTCRVVDDEAHAIFSCPYYSAQRAKFADLFAGERSLRSFLVSNPTHRVALFLTECRAARLIKESSHSGHAENDLSPWPDTALDIVHGLKPLLVDTYDSDSD